jgi:hypothetical protein
MRQAILEHRGLRFVRLRAQDVENDLPSALTAIRAALRPPLARGAGEGAGGEGRGAAPNVAILSVGLV